MKSVTMKNPKAPLPFFDAATGQYWLALRPDKFMRLSTSELRLHLRRAGLTDEKAIGELNEVENALAVSHIDRAVDYAGPLAGHNAGTFETSDGRKILVTNSPRLPSPKRGKWPTLKTFFEELLHGEQDYLFAWLQCSYRSLARGDLKPGQCLVLAGDAGCGKSLCQQFITDCFGGRSAKPYRYMTGGTTFNGDLARAEHWCIEDEHGSTDIRLRNKFGTAIKDVCANLTLSIHDKGRTAITLPTWRRLSVSVNRENENLQIVPPLNASLADKVTLLDCDRADLGNDTPKTVAACRAELPAFLWWLLNEFEIPKRERCPRYGVKSYHSQKLFEVLVDMSPEHRLLSLIDEVHFASITDKRELSPLAGSTEQIERSLRASAFCFAVEKLLYFSSACGVYLQRLALSHPDRVSVQRAHQKSFWTIKAPKDLPMTPQSPPSVF